eukprot:Skav216696  [mRNA]  locus=scaffold91:273576:278776:+ [translate_table: standard]
MTSGRQTDGPELHQGPSWELGPTKAASWGPRAQKVPFYAGPVELPELGRVPSGTLNRSSRPNTDDAHSLDHVLARQANPSSAGSNGIATFVCSISYPQLQVIALSIAAALSLSTPSSDTSDTVQLSELEGRYGKPSGGKELDPT